MLVPSVAAFVAEVVRFVDDDQVERAPVELFEIDVARLARVAAQVGMGEHGVVQAVFLEGVVAVVRPRRVAQPVVLQLLGTEHERPLVAQLEELDNRQRRPGLAQAHAVGDDAAVVAQQPVDGGGRAVFLNS